MAQGFGTTYGTSGTADYILGPNFTVPSSFTIFLWLWRHGAGGANLGRVMDVSAGMSWWQSGSGTTMEFYKHWSGTDLRGTFPFGTTIADDTWRTVSVTYDGSSTSNDPSVVIDGSGVTFTRTQTPTGAVDTPTAGLRLGNSGTTRAWNGKEAHATWWTGVLSTGELAALHAGANPLHIRSNSIVTYNPCYDQHGTFILPTGSTTISGALGAGGEPSTGPLWAPSYPITYTVTGAPAANTRRYALTTLGVG